MGLNHRMHGLALEELVLTHQCHRKLGPSQDELLHFIDLSQRGIGWQLGLLGFGLTHVFKGRFEQSKSLINLIFGGWKSSSGIGQGSQKYQDAQQNRGENFFKKK